ncbi:hypothetical protein [Paenibacillus taichungensis]
MKSKYKAHNAERNEKTSGALTGIGVFLIFYIEETRQRATRDM